MPAHFLNVRLNQAELELIDRLQAQTALTKSELVKRALRVLARETADVRPGGLFELGKTRFGRHGDVTRQAAEMKTARQIQSSLDQFSAKARPRHTARGASKP